MNLDALHAVFKKSTRPAIMLCSPWQAAAMQAMIDFRGRNWRRMKREVNKAIKKASKR